ncbi:MAG TPA: SDR family oxidoreductase [Candidatus Choladousia intestinigallinarum]|nr:SDR family oxidoreductase [Candidatus Choladousia intestinigallinarum]
MSIITRTTNVKEPTSVLERYTLKGKKAVVTGAAGGIGRATSMAFAELGADVAIVDIPGKLEESRAVAEEISRKYGVKTMAVGTDVSDQESVRAMAAQVADELGTIDVVHSNAGIGSHGDGPDISLEHWNRIISVNVTGVMLVDVACANVMIAHKHGGSIINTASLSSHIINQPFRKDSPAILAYPTSKAAVRHMTKSLALNYAKYGIRVNSISPGYIWSGLHAGLTSEQTDFEESTVPLGGYGCLDDVTGPVTLLATDLGRYMTGSDILFDGGVTIY